MELYLFAALVLMYILMAIFVRKNVQLKVWTTAYIVTAIAIAFLHVNRQDVMISVDQLNWYYLLYLFGSLSVVLGVINVWMFRKGLIKIFFTKSDDCDNDDDDDEDDKDDLK